jgi:hypothetical protein
MTQSTANVADVRFIENGCGRPTVLTGVGR